LASLEELPAISNTDLIPRLIMLDGNVINRRATNIKLHPQISVEAARKVNV